MAKETKAERQAREEQAEQMRQAAAFATYPERLFKVLERASAAGFRLTAKDNAFIIEQDEFVQCIYPYMTVYNTTVEANLEVAEQVVECVELRLAEAERKRKLRSDALAKLSKEEREALGLA